MKNIVLYSSKVELHEKLKLLRARPELVEKIANAGQKLVEECYSWKHVGRMVAESIKKPLRKKKQKNFFGFKTFTLDN